MKHCPKCKEFKEINEFHKNKSMDDGLSVYCKSCSSKYDKERYPKEKENRKKNAIKWYKNNTKLALEKSYKWRKENPEKYKEAIKRYALTPKRVFSQLKSRGTKIDQKDFLEWYNKQEKKCTYCEIPEILIKDNKKFLMAATLGRLTIDRKNPLLDYDLENIVFCCMRCNHIKSDFFSFEEMKVLAKKFIKPKWIK
jgi:5-methylcytosine-specific restriction endonuclease McrA